MKQHLHKYPKKCVTLFFFHKNIVFGPRKQQLLWEVFVPRELFFVFLMFLFSLFLMQDLRAAFQKIDYDRNGLITRPEFRRILDSFMLLLSDEEFDKLMLNLGIQKGAKLNYREFLKRFEHVETVEEGHPWLYSTHWYAMLRSS